MRTRLFRYSRTLLLITLLLSGITPGFAYLGGTAIDASFGSGGFADLPPYDGSYTVSAAIGFVHLPLSGGYMAFTRQTKAGTDRLVATRLTDNGAIDTNWGTGGQLLYAVAAPIGNDALVVAGIEGGAERIYVVGRFVSGITYLMVATFGADGTFQNFSSSDVHWSFQNYGVGEILAADAGATMGGQGVLIAVKGASNASGTVALVSAFYNNSLPGQINLVTHSLARPSFRIDWMQDRGDGKTDMLGTEGNQAVYLRVIPGSIGSGNNPVEAETFFNLPCDAGVTTSSVADGLVRPAGFGGDALVNGRVACSSGDYYSIAARVAAIDSTPAVIWGRRLEGGINAGLAYGNCQLPFSATGCSTANIAYSAGADASEAFVGSTYPALIHLDLNAAPAALTGADFNIAYPLVLPSHQYGSHFQYPYLVGIAAADATHVGLGRIAVDRIFADRVDTTP